MGLAASHARLCMLTLRKADVEGRLMHIANKKLSLARDSERVSEEYNNGLNATLLTYNTGAKDVPVTYGLLMSPTTQCMVTNANRAVVLDDSLWTALGSPAQGGALGDEKTFIATMAKVDPSTIDLDKLKSSAPPPSNVKSSIPTISTSYNDLDVLASLANPASGNAPFKDKLTQGDVYFGGTAFCVYQCNKDEVADKSSLLNKSGLYNIISQITTATATTVESKIGNKSAAVASAASAAAEATWNFFQNQMMNYKSDQTDSTPDGGGGFWSNAWNTGKSVVTSSAKNASGLSLVDGSLFTDGKNGYGGVLTGGVNIIGQDTYNYATYADPSVWNSSTINKTAGTVSIYNNTDAKQEFYIDPNQVALVFLRYFDAACNGRDVVGISERAYASKQNTTNGTYINLDSAQNDMILGLKTNSNGDPCVGARTKAGTNPSGTTDPTTTPATTGTTPTAAMTYYYNLYEAIKDRGWSKDSNVQNQDYLQGMIQYGNYGIKQYQNGNWVDLSTSSPDSPLNVKDDTDAQKKAEAKYDAEKDKITAKEKVLDFEQTNADTERQAVTTEMDSVKKLIDKNMDAFKLFQQG